MPDQRKPLCTVKRNKIDVAPEELKQLSFNEARRIKEHIYDALTQELYEAGCRTSARHVMCLAKTEFQLKKGAVIRDQVCDDHDLLMALFENLKTSEMAAKLSTDNCGLVTTCKCLYQIVLLLEPYPVKFDWLLHKSFELIAAVCEYVEAQGVRAANECMARIYFKYGVFLNLKGDELSSAIKYMEKALALTRDEPWAPDIVSDGDWGPFPTLHLVIGRKLSAVYLRNAMRVSETNIGRAVNLAQKAIITLAEVGIERNMKQVFRASLMRANFLIQSESYEVALKVLNKIRKDFKLDTGTEFRKESAEVLLGEGICLLNLNNRAEALIQLHRALSLSRRYKSRRTEADALLALGKLHAMSHSSNKHAQETFNMAQKIYTELGDVQSRKKVHYLLAKLRADEIFPYFMDLLKDSQEQYCNFHNLRQWKNHCKPFWKQMHIAEMKLDSDEIYCLLEDSEDCASRE